MVIPVAVTRVIQLLLRSTEYCTLLINLDGREYTMILLTLYYQTKGFNYDEIVNTDLCNIQYTTLGEAFIKYMYVERKETKTLKKKVAQDK